VVRQLQKNIQPKNIPVLANLIKPIANIDIKKNPSNFILLLIHIYLTYKYIIQKKVNRPCSGNISLIIKCILNFPNLLQKPNSCIIMQYLILKNIISYK